MCIIKDRYSTGLIRNQSDSLFDWKSSAYVFLILNYCIRSDTYINGFNLSKLFKQIG